MKLNNILTLLAVTATVLGSLSSCSDDKLELYSGVDSGLYLQMVTMRDQYGNPYSYSETVTFSFAGYETDYVQHNYGIIIRTMGNLKPYDRKYIIKVDPEGTTAVEGQDFSLADNDFIVHAGCNADTLKLSLFRTSNVRRGEQTVRLQLYPSDDFTLPIEAYKSSSSWSSTAEYISATGLTVKFSETYDPPYYWNLAPIDYFGPFTGAKMLALQEVMGWTYSDWRNANMAGSKIAYGRLDFAAKALSKYLQDMADAGTPVYDDDDEFMQLPGIYVVNYDAYK